MAGPYYVRSSDGDDGDSGLSWALAKATLGAAVTLAAAGDRIYVDDDHQETLTSDTTYTFAGTEGSPVEVIVVETDTTTAVSNYNASNQWISGNTLYHILISGNVYFWGIYLKPGDGVSGVTGTGTNAVMEKSKIFLDAPGGTDYMGVQGSGTKLTLLNSDLEFNDADDYLLVSDSGSFIWRSGSLSFDIASFIKVSGERSYIEVTGVDLSSMVGGYLITCTAGDTCSVISLKGIELNASPPDLVDGGPPRGGGYVIMDIAGNGNTIYKFRREYQYGYAQDETTKVITGKALYDGTNEFTAKMVSRATPTANFYDPWRYHLTTLRETGFAASRTYTVHIAQDHADTQPDALNDDEIWLEVVYPDDSTEQYNIKTDKITTPTTTPAAQTTSTETWAGLDTETRLQELSVQIDAADGKNGPVEIWVCLAKESITAYVCPGVYVS